MGISHSPIEVEGLGLSLDVYGTLIQNLRYLLATIIISGIAL